MQRRIHSLSPQLANQIAAGEVVERPASVVKELLENSLDAGADRIDLEVEQGGAKLIRVQDNGLGIHHDDLKLALAPHATSKVYDQNELEQVASLGFRGEALSSIASVSRFRLASRLDGETQGWELKVEGQSTGTPLPHPITAGTWIEVRDLFYNTPARRKFLRSERTEYLHIEEVLKRLALSRFDVAFSLQHNGRQALRLRAATDEKRQAQRIGDVLGKGFLQQALQLQFEAAGMRLWGWLSRAEASRSQSDGQYFYLNGRMVRDKLINHAVRQAYQSLLEPGRYPAYALYLEIEPQQVDVNVHPTKHEVRFRESRLVHDFIFRALKNALQEGGEPSTAFSAQATAETNRVEPEGAPSWAQDIRTTGVAELPAGYRGGRSTTAANASVSEPLGRARLVLHEKFLLTESAQGPLVLDLAAAQRHLLSHHLQSMLDEGSVRSQPLLIPETMTIDAGEIETLLAEDEALTRLGFEIERLAEQSVVVRRIPALLRGVELEPLLRLLVTEVSAGRRPDSPAVVDALISRVIATGKTLTLDEAERVLRQVEALPEQGQAFWRLLSLQQLQRWFEGERRG